MSRLKAGPFSKAKNEVSALITRCDLEAKARSKPGALSGGQRRKLQLALAFAGNSSLCCIDEASSGLDPLSRRKIWEILLRERGRRTIIFTTHALDEADALADHIFIMSAGRLLVQGSSAELKHHYGGGYRVVTNLNDQHLLGRIRAAQPTINEDEAVFRVAESSQACEIVDELERLGRHEVAVRSPGIEDVFLGMARSGSAQSDSAAKRAKSHSDRNESSDYLQDTHFDQTQKGKHTSFWKQVYLLFGKRLLVARRNYMPAFCALVVPVMTAAMATYYFLAGFKGIPCALGAVTNDPPRLTLASLQRNWGSCLSIFLHSKRSADLFRRYTYSCWSTRKLSEFARRLPAVPQICASSFEFRFF